MNNETTVDKVLNFADKWAVQAGEVIQGIAKQLGVATEYVYTVYTQQKFYEGVIGSSISGLTMILMIVIIITLWKITKNVDDEFSKWFSRTLGTVVPIIVFFIIMKEGLQTYLLMALNPEYYTMKDIVDQMSQLIGNNGGGK